MNTQDTGITPRTRHGAAINALISVSLLLNKTPLTSTSLMSATQKPLFPSFRHIGSLFVALNKNTIEV
jgi:hypothetical protein